VIKIFILDRNIYIRNFLIKDIKKDYISWFSGDNENLKYSRHYKKKYNRYVLIQSYKKFISSKNIFIGIFDKLNNKLIGTITIYINKKKKEGNLGVFIGNSKYKSRGYALQSCKMIINYLIKKNIVNSIMSGTRNENVKMINLMKNLKMKKMPKKDTKHTNYIFKKNM
jgi:RimJ/RimL family protein N-acetyltransferase